MKNAYNFITGNSWVTPLGVALAVSVVLAFRQALGWWAAACYLGILLATLVAATLEGVVSAWSRSL
jgi:hypothetical protein